MVDRRLARSSLRLRREIRAFPTISTTLAETIKAHRRICALRQVLHHHLQIVYRVWPTPTPCLLLAEVAKTLANLSLAMEARLCIKCLLPAQPVTTSLWFLTKIPMLNFRLHHLQLEMHRSKVCKSPKKLELNHFILAEFFKNRFIFRDISQIPGPERMENHIKSYPSQRELFLADWVVSDCFFSVGRSRKATKPPPPPPSVGPPPSHGVSNNNNSNLHNKKYHIQINRWWLIHSILGKVNNSSFPNSRHFIIDLANLNVNWVSSDITTHEHLLTELK